MIHAWSWKEPMYGTATDSNEWREGKLIHRDLQERVELVKNDTTVHEVEKNIGTLD